MLDASTRSYSSGLRMWIARCPRCQFAVRWSPRAAREPVRVWARLRALNTRLGVALSCGQGAGVFSALTAGLLSDRLQQLQATGAAVRPMELAGEPDFLVSATATAVLGTASGLAFLLGRGVTAAAKGWLLAWLVGALPVALFIGAVGVTAGGASVLSEIRRLWSEPAATFALLGAVPFASLLLTLALAPSLHRVLALFRARGRAKFRANRATSDLSQSHRTASPWTT
jgi:hypothetical protein